MPWTKTPEEFLCYSPYRLKGILLSLYMKQVSLSIYILFQGSIPSLALRPDISKYLPLHTLCYHYVWRVLYSSAG